MKPPELGGATSANPPQPDSVAATPATIASQSLMVFSPGGAVGKVEIGKVAPRRAASRAPWVSSMWCQKAIPPVRVPKVSMMKIGMRRANSTAEAPVSPHGSRVRIAKRICSPQSGDELSPHQEVVPPRTTPPTACDDDMPEALAGIPRQPDQSSTRRPARPPPFG